MTIFFEISKPFQWRAGRYESRLMVERGAQLMQDWQVQEIVSAIRVIAIQLENLNNKLENLELEVNLTNEQGDYSRRHTLGTVKLRNQ